MTKRFGLAAEFKTPKELTVAARRASAAGYTRMDGYSPFPIEGLATLLGHHKTPIPLIVLIGGILGGLGGYFMEWYALAVDYPLNIGGRPLNSWPLFIPVTFELTILSASICGLAAMLFLNRLPQPYHSIFNTRGFERASRDRFFLCIEESDPQFDAVRTREFLHSLEPNAILEVPD